MASVSNLDQDVRALRKSRYTPQAANEVRTWIETTLGHQIPPGDLLDALKDGVALCELANLALPPPGVKFKKSAMPFIQMENISHFLRACEMSPLNMPAHDRFLTVDLYESKDPAQVLQCLGAFSRQAHAANPSNFRSAIGPKKNGTSLSPSVTGSVSSNGSTGNWGRRTYGRPASPVKPSAAMPPSSNRALSPTLTGGSNGSQRTDPGSVKSNGPVSSWSKKTDESGSTPAWNIHQYGYMGGASQGNQGISFGARRQITSQAPAVPNLADKQRARREKEAEEEKLRQQAQEAEHKRRVEREAEEERDRLEEEKKWEEETRRIREEERRRVEEQKRKWAEQERKWQQDDEVRQKEDAEIKRYMSKKPPEKPRVSSGSVLLRGQTLTQYQREQAAAAAGMDGQDETPEQARVRELEKQLEEARERERQYQAEREERSRQGSRPSTAQTDRPSSAKESEASWAGAGDEREYLRKQWQAAQEPPQSSQRNASPPSLPIRTLPQPAAEPSPEPEPEPEDEFDQPPPPPARSVHPANARPLPSPQPESHEPQTRSANRTDAFLSSHAPPPQTAPRISSSAEAGYTSQEQSSARDARLASQQKTKAGAWASKSLLEREMERERERQREWEAEQKAAASRPRDPDQGIGEGQTWDVNQYGYMGGDGMNKGSSAGSGINMGGRRQILGPRSMGQGK